MSAVEEVYEELKHLDIVLGDPVWCSGSHGFYISHKLWAAIKKDLKIDESFSESPTKR